MYSTDGQQRLLYGSSQEYTILHRSQGVIPVEGDASLLEHIRALNSNKSQSLFGETFSKTMMSSIEKTIALQDEFEQTTLETTFEDDKLSSQFKHVSKLIKMRTNSDTEEGLERGVFVVKRNNFDTHNTWDMSPMLSDVNQGTKL